jgi:acetyl/propionyl-CoA carboxylase alpha subunit
LLPKFITYHASRFTYHGLMNKQFTYQIGEQQKTVTIEQVGDRFRVRVGDVEYDVSVRQGEPGQLDLEVDGQQWQVYTVHTPTRHYIAVGGDIWELEKPRPQGSKRHTHDQAPDTGNLTATMPGLVREILVAEGADVARGDTLLVLEAMKMELRLTAPYAGRVLRVHCAPGQGVERGQILVEVEANETNV